MGPWRRSEGDGTLIHTDPHYTIDLGLVETLQDVEHWIGHVADKRWATKEGLAQLMLLLLARIREVEERRSAVATQTMEAAGRETLALDLAGLAGRLGGSDAFEPVCLGARWGNWTYEPDHDHGPSVVFRGRQASGYRVSLEQLGSPDELARMSQHLVRKPFLTGADVLNGISAMVACARGADLPEGWERVDGVVCRAT